MASMVEVLKSLFDRQKLLLQQIADQNQQICMVMEQLKEIEKQRGNPDNSTPNSVMVNGGATEQNDRAGSEEVQPSRNIMHLKPNVEVPTSEGSKVAAPMYLQGKAGSWFCRYLLGRPRTDLDDVIANLCARSGDGVGNQLEAAVRTDALQMLDESPKRGPGGLAHYIADSWDADCWECSTYDLCAHMGEGGATLVAHEKFAEPKEVEEDVITPVRRELGLAFKGSQKRVAEALEAMGEKEAMEMRANLESTGIVTRKPLVLQLHRTEEGSEEYAAFLHLAKQRRFTDFAVVRKEIQDETARVTVAAEGQPDSIVKDLEDMFQTYVEKPNCIILAISPANHDIATSDAIKLARAVDPSGDWYLSLQNVKKVVFEADGYQPHFLPPEQGYRRLIEGTLNYFKAPGEASVNAIHFVLKGLELVAATIVVFDPGGTVITPMMN